MSLSADITSDGEKNDKFLFVTSQTNYLFSVTLEETKSLMDKLSVKKSSEYAVSLQND